MYKLHLISLLVLFIFNSCSPIGTANLMSKLLVEEVRSMRKISKSTQYALNTFNSSELFLNSEIVNLSYPNELKNLFSNLEASGFIDEKNKLKEMIASIATKSFPVIQNSINNQLTFIPVTQLENFLYEEQGAITNYFINNASIDISNSINPIILSELDNETILNIIKKESLDNFHKVSINKGLKKLNYSQLEKIKLEKTLNTLIIDSFFNLMKEGESNSGMSLRDFFGNKEVMASDQNQ